MAPSCDDSCTTQRCHYRSGAFDLSFGLTGEFPLILFVVAVPRDGFRFFWAMPQMYSFLGLSSFSKPPSKWIWDFFPSWRRYLAAQFLKNVFLHSPPSERIDAAAQALPTSGFLMLLLRFLNGSPQKRGLRRVEQRASCQSIFQDGFAIFVVEAESLPGWGIPFRLEYTWQRNWPMSSPTPPDVVLPVSQAMAGWTSGLGLTLRSVCL